MAHDDTDTTNNDKLFIEEVDDKIITEDTDSAESRLNGRILKLLERYVKYSRVIVDCAWHGQTEFFVPTDDEEFDMLAIMNGGKIVDFVLPMHAFGRNIGKLIVSRIGEIGNEYVRILSNDQNRYLYTSKGYGKNVSSGGDAAIEEICRVSGNVVRMYARHLETLDEDEEYVKVIAP